MVIIIIIIHNIRPRQSEHENDEQKFSCYEKKTKTFCICLRIAHFLSFLFFFFK